MRLSWIGVGRPGDGPEPADKLIPMVDPGCGCCGGTRYMKRDDLDSFREELVEMLEFVNEILREV